MTRSSSPVCTPAPSGTIRIDSPSTTTAWTRRRSTRRSRHCARTGITHISRSKRVNDRASPRDSTVTASCRGSTGRRRRRGRTFRSGIHSIARAFSLARASSPATSTGSRNRESHGSSVMRVSRHPALGAFALLVLLTLAGTWPQGLYLRSQVAAHHDPRFSMWRLAWIAHALRTDPRHLFDANIFYPETRTLAYSDATLLEGAIAAPMLWAGVAPILVYNVLLLGGIAASGFGMFVVARYLTFSSGAALVSAVVFMLAPYRFEHYMHLELQWAMWMPLAFWAVHRAVDEESWKFGALAGVFVWLQTLSCVYYGFFLALMVAALAMLLLASDTRRARA